MIRFRTLGSVDLRANDGGELSAVLAQPKRVALLAFLALARPGGFHRRDRLLSLFWPELDDTHARDSLNQAIRFLRQALGPGVLVSRGGDEIALDRERLSCDAAEFRSAIDDGRLADALDLYRGDLLDGFFASESRGFEEWLESERAEYRARAANAARMLAEREEAAGNMTRALRWGRQEATLANNDERAIRRWLAMLVRAGDRAGALQAYEEFARRLATEYETEPSAETRALLDVIRRDPSPQAPRVVSPVKQSVPPLFDSSSAAPNAGRLAVGDRLAGGRYVIEGELGAGGMAAVYLAHDVRHDRHVAVKVLRPEIAWTVGPEGFLREIRIAAQLQHPHIVPVFDSGTEAGNLYYVMPHVAGETLRARLAREGTLPYDDAIRIAHEVADALAYAHKHGIVHRDIKPENVLLTGGPDARDFHAMVTDFGIACAIAKSGAEERLVETGVVIGSPAYMSPERVSGDTSADERSDVYSLGCVLYEMLAGKPPVVGATRFAVLAKHSEGRVPNLLEVRPDVTPHAQAVVERALATSPANRYADAADFGRAIRQLTAERGNEAIVPRRLTWRRVARSGVVAVVVLVALVAVWGPSRTLGIGPARLGANAVTGPTDRVFVADFEPPARDSGLGDVATQLLMTEIRRSASIPLVDAKQRQLALAAFGLPDSSRIQRDRAREFASRANAKVYVVGAIDLVGRTYVLRATLHKTEDGTELERFRQEAKTADDIIGAIDRLGRDIRARLGAAMSEVRGAPELVWAVTPSLTAARFYSEATRRAAVTGDLGASSIALLERAVAEDSTFAMAYVLLSAYSANSGDAARAVWAAERAFRYREKLPRYSQLGVEGFYYSQPVADYDLEKAIAAYEAAAEISPEGPPSNRNANNLGVLYVRKRDFERALLLYREALKRDSTSFAAQNINVPLWATGRKEEARTNVARNLARLSSSATFVWGKSNLASADFFVDSAVAILTQGISEFRGDNRRRGAVHQLLTSAERTRGHIASALQHQDSALSLSQSSDTARNITASVLYRANVLAWDLGRPAEARRLLESFEVTHPPGNAGPMTYRWIDLAQAFAQAGAPAKAHALLATYERRASAGQKVRVRQPLELARGEIAMAEKRYSDAISAFRSADVEYCTVCALAPLAHAYDRAGNADSAIAVFERYLTTNWWGRTDVDQRWLAWAYKRLGELHEAEGHLGKATIYYERFIDLWKDADPELQPKLAEVRKRLAALRTVQGKNR